MLGLQPNIRIFNTSGLPGLRPVTPRACGARRRSIHPLHRAPRAHHCCPTRAGPVPFRNRILCRNRQFCTVFRIFVHQGSKFSGCFLSVHVYIIMIPMSHESFMEIGPHVFQYSGRQTRRRTDRCASFIFEYCLWYSNRRTIFLFVIHTCR